MTMQAPRAMAPTTMSGRTEEREHGELPGTEAPWLVVGLGNPGPAYAGHRHNVGQRVVQELRARDGGSLRTHSSRLAAVLETRWSLAGSRVVLAIPTSYMNDSGGSVAALARFYRVPADRLVVVHDELDIPFGAIRVKLGGGDNGHNGLRSVRARLGTGQFYRVRLGVGRPQGRVSPAAFVLSNYRASERDSVVAQVVRAADAVESLAAEGLDRTQSEFNA